MLDTVKQVGIRLLIGLVATGIIIMGVAAGLASMITGSATSSSSNNSATNGVADLGGYCVKTDEAGAMQAMTKEELKKAIDACYSGQTHDNLISTLDDFISVQKKYKINAAFMVAITIIESSGGTAWDAINPETHNWMSVSWGEKWNGDEGKTQPNGDHTWCWYSSFSEAVQKFGIYLSSHDWAYFTDGKYKVSEIAPTYCNAEWGTKIEAELDKLYSAAGVSVASSGSYDGGVTGIDGNSRITYEYAGKTYIVYAQGDSAYNWVSYAGGNIGDSGCGPTSVAICVSAYDKSVSPKTVVDICAQKYPDGNTAGPGSYGYASPNGVFNKYLEEFGLTCTCYEGGFTETDANRILSHLRTGNPIILNYQGLLQLNAGNGFDSGPGHFVTLLGLDDNNNIYVGNPAGGCSGYTTMTNIYNTPEIRRYYLVTKK